MLEVYRLSDITINRNCKGSVITRAVSLLLIKHSLKRKVVIENYNRHLSILPLKLLNQLSSSQHDPEEVGLMPDSLYFLKPST